MFPKSTLVVWLVILCPVNVIFLKNGYIFSEVWLIICHRHDRCLEIGEPGDWNVKGLSFVTSIFSLLLIVSKDRQNLQCNMEMNVNQFLFCGHCSLEVGTLQEIIANDIIATHQCFTRAEDVNIDFAERKICGAIPSQTPINNPINNLPHCSNRPSVPNVISSNSAEKSLNVTEGWTDNIVKLLIATFIEHKSKFDDPKYTKKKVWSLISQDLMVKGVEKSSIKCDEKWRNLRKTYDKVKLHLRTSGADKIVWKFYEDFQNIYSKDPYFEPVAVASSNGIKGKTGKEGTNNEAKNLSPGESKRPRKQKRHEEKISLKREMFEWLKENHMKKD